MLALSLLRRLGRLGRLSRLGRLLLPSLLTPERLKSRHGRANWSRRHKHGSAPPINHGCHSWWKACCSARRWLLLLRLLLRLLPVARLWAGSENLPCAMGVLGKLHVIGVPVGLATVFVRMGTFDCAIAIFTPSGTEEHLANVTLQGRPFESSQRDNRSASTMDVVVFVATSALS